jgi:uncharacterized membrane protein
MKPWAFRLVVGIGATVAMFGVFLVLGTVLDEEFDLRGDMAFLASFLVCGVVTVCLWFFAYREVLRANADRLVKSGLSLVVVLVLGVGGAILLTPLPRYGAEAIYVGMGFVGLGGWVAWMAVIWRPTRREVDEMRSVGGRIQVRCLGCGYSMIGLREARCPECGRQYTLDELIAGQVYAPPPVEPPRSAP